MLYIIDKNTSKVIKIERDQQEKMFQKHVVLPLLPNRPPFEVPIKARDFYHHFGKITHDETGKIIEDLADYQYEFWDYKGWAINIKSQKVGISTSTLLEDFQYTCLPEGAGKDVLIVAPTMKAAQQHILDLKKWIRASARYSQYLITDVKELEELLFEEEKTKAYVIYIKNFYNSMFPSRIIALGGSLPSVWSWKRVGRIHMSDVAQIDMIEEKQNEFFSTVFSRLAITRGLCKIETPPAGQQGFIFRLYEKLIERDKGKDPKEDVSRMEFKLFITRVEDAINAGVITTDTLEAFRKTLDPYSFASKFGCSFINNANAWLKDTELSGDVWLTT